LDWKKVATVVLVTFGIVVAGVILNSREETGADLVWSKPRVFMQNDGTEPL